MNDLYQNAKKNINYNMNNYVLGVNYWIRSVKAVESLELRKQK